ncbi:MAG: preprotein translocase subunit YajC [Actinomycetota bacterium]
MISILAQADSQSSSPAQYLIPLLLMGGVFYFLLIRPQRMRQRQQQSLLDRLRIGDDVMTSGGLFGTVKRIDEDTDTVTVEIAPGTEVRMLRRAIAQRLVEDEGDGDDGTDEGSDEEAGSRP